MATWNGKGAALVTGAGRRIGRTIARTLAEAGFAVALHCRHSREEAELFARRIIEEGGSAAVVAADLADPGAVAGLVPAARAAIGPLTLLVNNASIFVEDQLATLDLAGWESHIAVNLRAPVFLSQAFAAQVPADAADASVVNIIDQRVLSPRPDYFSYYVSKAGLLTATMTMAQALAPRIRVNGVGPGPTFQNDVQSQDEFEHESASTLLGHGSSGRDIAEAVLYLARARSVTGQMLAVDGGQHLSWSA